MQDWQQPAKFAAAVAVWCCCALVGNLLVPDLLDAQTTQRQASGVAPENPLRSGSPKKTAEVKTDRQVQPAQATEPLPRLQPVPAEPDLAPQPQSVLVPNAQPPEQIMEDPNTSWPADAPAMQRYGNGQRFGHGGGTRGFMHAEAPPREPWFQHDDPNDPARHTGWGDPLTGTSWLNRPWYVGVFVGGLLADDLIADHVEADSAPFLGVRLGNDFDHFWGWEVRYAYTRIETFTGAGVPIPEPCRQYYVDVALQYYPWGDSHWRPYLLAGVGFMNARYENDAHRFIDDTALSVPLGFGLKIYQNPWFTIRFDATDNLTFGGGHLDSMHNFSLAMGVELRFGGKSRPSYFPWTGNTSYW